MMLNTELRGAILDKVWVTNGKTTALFKPDTEADESTIELKVYQIGKSLGVNCAEAEKALVFGKKGTLSHNFHTYSDVAYCPIRKNSIQQK
jgi:hypothetical protein